MLRSHLARRASVRCDRLLPSLVEQSVPVATTVYVGRKAVLILDDFPPRSLPSFYTPTVLPLPHSTLHPSLPSTSTAHPCNLTHFTLFGGPTPDPLKMEVLIGDGRLANDAKEEKVSCVSEIGARGEEDDVDEEREKGGKVVRRLCSSSLTR